MSDADKLGPGESLDFIELPDIGELVGLIEQSAEMIRYLGIGPGVMDRDRDKAKVLEQKLRDVLARADAVFNTDTPETAHQSVAKASENNGRIRATEGTPMAGEVSRASIGAASDADDGRNAEASGGAAPVVTLSRALLDIAAERRRQKYVEGWSAEHDDTHTQGELAQAAMNYAGAAIVSVRHGVKGYNAALPPLNGWVGFRWPWSSSWWKPLDARRNLVKAGALIAAEIERLDRAEEGGADV